MCYAMSGREDVKTLVGLVVHDVCQWNFCGFKRVQCKLNLRFGGPLVRSEDRGQ